MMFFRKKCGKECITQQTPIRAAIAVADLNSDVINVANTEPRNLVAILADKSSSTLESGANTEIDKGLTLLVDQLKCDPVTCAAVELLVAGFPNIVDQPGATKGFHTPANMGRLDLPAGGRTPGAQAVLFAAKACVHRVNQLDERGIPLANVPLVLLLTDGEFTDTSFFAQTAGTVQELEESRRVLFASFYTEGADLSVLKKIFRFPPAPISNLTGFFSSLGRSLRTLSLGKLDSTNADPRGIILRQLRDERAK